MHFDRAMRLNPFYPDQYLWDKAGALTKLHRFEDAIACIQEMNNPAQGRRILACCYAHLGRITRPALKRSSFARNNLISPRRLGPMTLYQIAVLKTSNCSFRV